ncbi:MAG: Vps62-related protein [Methanocella sp.]
MESNKGTLFMIVTGVIGVILLAALAAAAVTDNGVKPGGAGGNGGAGGAMAPGGSIGNSLPGEDGNGVGTSLQASMPFYATETGSFIMRCTDHGSCADQDLTVFTTIWDFDLTDKTKTWYWVGDIPDTTPGHVWAPSQDQPLIVVHSTDPNALARPVDWKQVWNSKGCKRNEVPGGDVALWVPIAPRGYVALGCVLTNSFNKPSGGLFDTFRCVKEEYCVEGKLADTALWTDAGSHASLNGAIWRILPVDDGGVDMGTYWAGSDYYQPLDKVYCLKSQYLI